MRQNHQLVYYIIYCGWVLGLSLNENMHVCVQRHLPSQLTCNTLKEKDLFTILFATSK